MFDLLKPILARFAGSVAGALVAWLGSKGVALETGDTSTIVSFMVLFFGIIYGVVHNIVAKKLEKK